jgi:VanZ family protein
LARTGFSSITPPGFPQWCFMTIDKLARVLFLLLAAAVLYLTLTPTPPHVALDNLPYGDKIEHGLAFASLALMARLGFPRVPVWQMLEHLSFLGAMIEVAQATPGLGRDCDWHDWLADTGGVALGLAAAHVVLNRLRAMRAARPPLTPPLTLH